MIACARSGTSAGRDSDLGDLAELALDGRLATEDVDQHLELEVVGVELHDRPGEVGERTLADPHAVAHLVLELGLATAGLLTTVGLDRQEVLDLTPAERRRLLAVAALADEAGDAG